MRITKTKTSITLVDNDGNTVTVIKSPAGFNIYSKFNNNKVSNDAYALQKAIRANISTPCKDNTEDRFAKLARLFKTIEHATFKKLLNLISVKETVAAEAA